MYRIYTTEGLILSASPSGEANQSFLIYTKELGLVRATAQGVRLEKSKLKSGLQEMSWSKVSLVKGKDIWRLTNAELILNVWSEFRENKPLVFVFARSLALLRRLLHGEERNDRLFEHLRNACQFASLNQLAPELIKNFEYILALRILHSLGYVGDSPDFESLVKSPFFTIEMLTTLDPIRARVLNQINNSIKETQL